MDKYKKRIISIIVNKTGAEPEDIQDDSYLQDDLNISDLELHDIYDAIQEEYSIEFEDEEKENIETVIDLVDMVVEKIE